MKDVLVKTEGTMEQNARKITNKPSDNRENIILAGGFQSSSVCVTGVKDHGRRYKCSYSCISKFSVREIFRFYIELCKHGS